MIKSRRLNLLPASLRTLQAELSGAEALAALLGVEVPADWPPELYDEQAVHYIIEKIRSAPSAGDWWFHYFVTNGRQGPSVAIGAGGYKGPPDRSGTVEIGYSVLSDYRRRGYATEAAMALVNRAFQFKRVSRVIAETLPHLKPSIGVLDNCGFRLAGAGTEPGVVRYELRRDWAGLS